MNVHDRPDRLPDAAFDRVHVVGDLSPGSLPDRNVDVPAAVFAPTVTDTKPLPKQPRYICNVQAQVISHPGYKDLSPATRFAFNAMVGGFSWPSKENSRYSRQMWNHLYLGIPLPVDQ